MTFRGWPQDALDFYDGLEADNSKTYFHAHKQVYDECVKAPFLELSAEIEREFGPHARVPPQPRHPLRQGQDAVQDRGRGRDRRAKAAPRTTCRSRAPASTSGPATTTRPPISSNDSAIAVADAKTGPQLAAAVAALRKLKFEVGARESLQRAPRGYPNDHPQLEFLRMKGMHVGKTFGAPRWLHSPAALDRIVKTWRDAAPMTKWFDKNVGPSTIAPPEPD